MICRTSFDCDGSESFFTALSGGQCWQGPHETLAEWRIVWLNAFSVIVFHILSLWPQDGAVSVVLPHQL